jgi:protein TilB
MILDGKEVTRSERISATQHLREVRMGIAAHQKQHALRREKEKEEFRKKHENKQRQAGFDGRWYTDPNAHVKTEEKVVTGEKTSDHNEEEEEEAYTPEYRIKSYQDMARQKMEQVKEPESVTYP